MEKHSKRRDMEELDEEYAIRKKLKRLQKRLVKIDKRIERSTSPRQQSQRCSLSPTPTVLTRTDGFSSRGSSFSGDRFDNEPFNDLVELEFQEDKIELTEESERKDVPHIDSELDQTVLSILGYRSSPAKNVPPPFQKEIALSWLNTLEKGLTDEERLILMQKYPPPENCLLLEAPKLNPGIAGITKDVVIRRDNKISDLQNQIGSALSALGQVLSTLLKEVNKGNNMSHIQLISDSSRLLLDFHYKQSISRRELVSLNHKNEFTETSNGFADGWLFGSKLEECIKAAKEGESSGLEIKPSKPNIFKKNPFSSAKKNKNLNPWLLPYQQGKYQGGRRPQVQNIGVNHQQKPYLQSQERKMPWKELNRFKNRHY